MPVALSRSIDTILTELVADEFLIVFVSEEVLVEEPLLKLFFALTFSLIRVTPFKDDHECNGDLTVVVAHHGDWGVYTLKLLSVDGHISLRVEMHWIERVILLLAVIEVSLSALPVAHLDETEAATKLWCSPKLHVKLQFTNLCILNV